MKSIFMILGGLLVILLASEKGLSQDNIQTTVGIEYDNDRCGTNLMAPPELNLTLPIGSTALDIMEGAAKITKNYRFVVTFLGEMGYRIDSVNGTVSGEYCQWHLFISEGNLNGTLTQLHYGLPSNVTMAILHFTTEQDLDEPLALSPEIGSKILTVYYIIEYEDECNNGTELVLPPLKINITQGQTALHVLENAVHSVDNTQYRFTATYYSFGYHIHTINGTSDTFGKPVPKIPCYWAFLTKQSNSTDRVSASVGLAHYVIPADNYTVIMRYTNEVYSPGSGGASLNIPFASVLLLSMLFSIMFM